MWGFEHYGIVPDLTTFGKGISSSLPLSAVAGRPDVMDLHPPGSMTSTHTGNPVCCAAALASIDLVVKEDLAGNARRMGDVLHKGLQSLKSKFPEIGWVDGKGLVAGVACVKPGTKEPDGDLAWEVVNKCIQKGVLMFSPVGLLRQHGEDRAAAGDQPGSHPGEPRRARGSLPRGVAAMSLAQVTVVGGGMITHDQILPSLYQMQRQGAIGEIAVCALKGRFLKDLSEAEMMRRAFPGQSFRAYPDLGGDLDQPHPDLFREVLAQMPPRNVVVVAVPDQLHFDTIMTALQADQHVCTVKPLVLTAREVEIIEAEALKRGLVVGIEYHKRFDDRSLMARRRYRDGLFGEFRLGTAALLEKWYYRHSNFQNWCTGGELGRLHLHRLPLRRPGAFHHRPAADVGERLRHPGQVSERQGGLPLDRRARHLEQRRVR